MIEEQAHNLTMMRWMRRRADGYSAKRSLAAKYIFFWVALTLMGLGFSASFYLSNLSAAQPVTWVTALLFYGIRLQIWFAFSPFILWLDKRFRSKGTYWPRILLLHFMASIILSLINTGLYGSSFWMLDFMTNMPINSLSRFYQSVWIINQVMGMVTYKIILTSHYAFDYYEKFWEEKHRSAMLEAQLAQSQLQALKMQIQPHFLFNTLNSISSLVLEDSRAAVHMIARLGDFLRLTIDNNGTQQVTLERELDFLKCYLEIEQTRFRDRLKVSMDVDPDALPAQVPNLILQPIVENAIRHGIAPRARAGHIRIQARLHGELLHMQVSDDGPGLPENGDHASSLKEGVGLANTRARLRRLYQNDFRLDMTNGESGGVVVTVEIPFIERAEDVGELLFIRGFKQ